MCSSDLVHDVDGDFARRCNMEMVSLAPLADPDEIAEVRLLIERHVAATGSELGARILAGWPAAAARFVRVLPGDYQRVLEAQARMLATGMSPDEAAMAAFEENATRLARVGGA